MGRYSRKLYRYIKLHKGLCSYLYYEIPKLDEFRSRLKDALSKGMPIDFHRSDSLINPVYQDSLLFASIVSDKTIDEGIPELLLEYGANPNIESPYLSEVNNLERATVLNAAIDYVCPLKLIKQLLQNGAHIDETSFDAASWSFISPTEGYKWYIDEGQKEDYALSVIKLLLDNGGLTAFDEWRKRSGQGGGIAEYDVRRDRLVNYSLPSSLGIETGASQEV